MSGSDKPPLPHGWVVHVSKTYPDRVFYFNTITNCTTWNLPIASKQFGSRPPSQPDNYFPVDPDSDTCSDSSAALIDEAALVRSSLNFGESLQEEKVDKITKTPNAGESAVHLRPAIKNPSVIPKPKNTTVTFSKAKQLRIIPLRTTESLESSKCGHLYESELMDREKRRSDQLSEFQPPKHIFTKPPSYASLPVSPKRTSVGSAGSKIKSSLDLHSPPDQRSGFKIPKRKHAAAEDQSLNNSPLLLTEGFSRSASKPETWKQKINISKATDQIDRLPHDSTSDEAPLFLESECSLYSKLPAPKSHTSNPPNLPEDLLYPDSDTVEYNSPKPQLEDVRHTSNSRDSKSITGSELSFGSSSGLQKLGSTDKLSRKRRANTDPTTPPETSMRVDFASALIRIPNNKENSVGSASTLSNTQALNELRKPDHKGEKLSNAQLSTARRTIHTSNSPVMPFSFREQTATSRNGELPESSKPFVFNKLPPLDSLMATTHSWLTPPIPLMDPSSSTSFHPVHKTLNSEIQKQNVFKSPECLNSPIAMSSRLGPPPILNPGFSSSTQAALNGLPSLETASKQLDVSDLRMKLECKRLLSNKSTSTISSKSMLFSERFDEILFDSEMPNIKLTSIPEPSTTNTFVFGANPSTSVMPCASSRNVPSYSKPVSQPVNLPVSFSTNTPSATTSFSQLIKTPISQSSSTPVKQTVNLPITQSSSTPVKKTVNLPISQSSSTPVKQTVNLPISQPVNTVKSTLINRSFGSPVFNNNESCKPPSQLFKNEKSLPVSNCASTPQPISSKKQITPSSAQPEESKGTTTLKDTTAITQDLLNELPTVESEGRIRDWQIPSPSKSPLPKAPSSESAQSVRSFGDYWAPKEAVEEMEEAMDWETDNSMLSAPKSNVSSTTSNSDVLDDLYKHLQHKSWHIVVDTNIFIEHLDFLAEVRDTPYKDRGLPTIVFPYIVFQELDGLKDRNRHKEKKGGKVDQAILNKVHAAISFINTNLNSEHPRFLGQSLGEHLQHEEVFKGSVNNDDRILHFCSTLQKKGIQVSLLTDDRNLRNKALSSRIEAMSKADMQKLSKGTRIIEMVITPPSPPDSDKDNPMHHNMEATRAEKIYCQTKVILSDVLRDVLQKGMKEEFKTLWSRLIIRKPPWTLDDIVYCFKYHWISVFSSRLPKTSLELVTNIEETFHKYKMRKGFSHTLRDMGTFVEICIQLMVSFYKLNFVTDKVKAAVQKLTQLKDLCSLGYSGDSVSSQGSCNQSLHPPPPCETPNSMHSFNEPEIAQTEELQLKAVHQHLQAVFEKVNSFCNKLQNLQQISTQNPALLDIIEKDLSPNHRFVKLFLQLNDKILDKTVNKSSKEIIELHGVLTSENFDALEQEGFEESFSKDALTLYYQENQEILKTAQEQFKNFNKQFNSGVRFFMAKAAI